MMSFLEWLASGRIGFTSTIDADESADHARSSAKSSIQSMG